jgi:hypothetical protein
MYPHDHHRTSQAPVAPEHCPGAVLWPAPEIILDHVAFTYGISLQQLRSKRRDLLTVEAKRVAIHLLAASGQGASAIGRLMCLHHSTVLHHLTHVHLDLCQQQLVFDLQSELHRMASCVQGSSQNLPRASGRSSGSPRTPTGGTHPVGHIPTLGAHTDHLQIISRPL